MGAMESPQPRDLVMQTVIPVLRQVVGDADDEHSPEERNPREAALQPGQYYRQYPQPHIGEKRPEHDVACGEAGNVSGPLGLRPAVFVQAEGEFHDPQSEYKKSDSIILQGAERVLEPEVEAENGNRRLRCLLPRSLAGNGKR